MIKQKVFFSEIETEERKLKGCFTEESYLVIGIPSFTEKAKLTKQFATVDRNDPLQIFEILDQMVKEVSCNTVDGQAVTDLDNLLAYADGAYLINYLTELITNGYVPKKR